MDKLQGGAKGGTVLAALGGTIPERNHGSTMLVLSRKVGERILLGDQIRITVVRVSGGGVRLGIEAPSDVSVVREEVVLPANELAPRKGNASSVAKASTDE